MSRVFEHKRKSGFFKKKIEKIKLPPKYGRNFIFDPELSFCISEKNFLKKLGVGKGI